MNGRDTYRELVQATETSPPEDRPMSNPTDLREALAKIIHGDAGDWEDLKQASMSHGPRQKWRDQVAEVYRKAAAILALSHYPSGDAPQDKRPPEAPEYLWYGEVDAVDVITFGRWPKRGAKWRYKWADIQTTEYDHPKTARQAFEETIASLNYDGAETDSLTVGEIRRALSGDAPAQAIKPEDMAWAEAEIEKIEGPAQAEPVAWCKPDEIPPVKLRNMDEFIVAVHNPKTNEIYTFAAYYLNGYQVEMDDTPCANCDKSCEDGDGCPFTGWYILVGDGRYDAGCFHALELREGRTLVGWTDIPLYASPPAQPAWQGMETALKTAIQHIEHMAAWITQANAEYHPIPSTYSFESLGEDLPGIKAALAQPSSAHTRSLTGDARDGVIEECAKEADLCIALANIHYGVAESVGANMAARRIRALKSSPTKDARDGVKK